MKIKSNSLIAPAVLVLFIFSNVLTAEARTLRKAPELPDVQGEIFPGTGFIPPPMDLSHLTGKRPPNLAKPMALPDKWDWRQQGKVTPVKNQGVCGSCYAFAAIANLESKLLIDGAGTYDFSENHAKECNWYETSCDGGWYTQMANLFSKKGTVLETCDPYIAADTTCKSSCEYIATLLDWRIISTNSVPSTSVLKEYIYTYGPVFTSFYAGNGLDSWSSEFVSYDGSYTLYTTSSVAPNHAVLIVGWDDNLTHTGGTGGWIVKNSWGTSWGGDCGYGPENGYFTIAYEAASIGMYSSFCGEWQNYDDTGELLYHDEGGWSTSWGYDEDVTAWGMCRYIPLSPFNLTRVEFWTSDVTTDIDVYIYDTFNGSSLSSPLATKLDNSFNEAGYHSLVLDAPLSITAGNDIYVVMKVTNESYCYPIVADDEGPAESLTSYMSEDGTPGSWTDVGASETDPSDIAIRIRSGVTSFVVTAPNGGEYWDIGIQHLIKWTASDSIESVKIEYSTNSGTNWSSIVSSTPNDGSYSWEVPSTPSTYCRIRVSDAADGDPWDMSNATFTILTRVWPGDLDNNGAVNVEDVLPLAQYWYERGTPRDSVYYGWSGNAVDLWSTPAATYADANGSGRVDNKDFLPICLNWNRKHGDTTSISSLAGGFNIEGSREILTSIYEGIKGAQSGPQYEIKLFLEDILGISPPGVYRLYQNYPNPFNSSTVIRYHVPVDSRVKITVYNIIGQKVAVLVDGMHENGNYTATWDGVDNFGNNVASCIYLYRIESSGRSSIRRMTYIK